MLEIDQTGILQFHAFLLANTPKRLASFERALQQRVSPGDVVLDLGTGSGILAMLALRAGARKVYGVEDSDAIELARILCAANGVTDRIDLRHQPSMSVELPAPADVLVADISDTFGLQPGGLGCLLDARRRLLRETAVLIPSAMDIYVAPVEAAETYDRVVEMWTRPVSGIDVSALRACAVNNRYPNRFNRSALLGERALLTRLPFATVDTRSFGGDLTLTIARPGVLHGLCGWYSADLADGIAIDNSPEGTSNYNQAFFPIERPLTVQAGDTLQVSVHSYDNLGCQWRVDANTAADGAVTSQHSTAHGFPLSDERLVTMLPGYRPRLSGRGRAEQFVLGLCDGQCSLERVTDAVLARFPDLFRSTEEAAGFARSIIARTT
jgi:protein arginine N-methyltransferase 1